MECAHKKGEESCLRCHYGIRQTKREDINMKPWTESGVVWICNRMDAAISQNCLFVLDSLQDDMKTMTLSHEWVFWATSRVTKMSQNTHHTPNASQSLWKHLEFSAHSRLQTMHFKVHLGLGALLFPFIPRIGWQFSGATKQRDLVKRRKERHCNHLFILRCLPLLFWLHIKLYLSVRDPSEELAQIRLSVGTNF